MYKKTLLLIIYILMIISLAFGQEPSDKLSFNGDWLFYKGEAEGAELAGFNDTGWRKLDLPHDWAIEGPFDTKYNARCGGLPFHGTGWYRKHFVLPLIAKNKIVRIEFEGAMYDAHVWVNGKFVGNRPYGYIGFEFDVTNFLKYDGSENIIAVRLTPKDLSSRWYPGAGIYRPVWLKIDEPVYVELWGTYITTPTVTIAKAVVQNETVVVNKDSQKLKIEIKHEYYSPKGEKVSTVIDSVVVEANSQSSSGTYCNIEKPDLWDIETPNLYTAVTTISKDGNILDQYNTRFGIRKISYTSEGFYLNGRKIRFNGVCLHHDNGSLGAAYYRRADQRKLEIMKSMGVNAIRTSHNPPSEGLLDLCDEMGLLVMDEAFDIWRIPKVENGYNVYFDEWSEQDLKDMIRRDRNHPSVVIWSIGNEILEQKDKANGWEVARRLNSFCKVMDPTRPTTAGFNIYPAPFNNNLAQQVDISGMNYKPLNYGEVHKNYPDLPIVGSETSSCTSSRGVYHLPIEKYETHESKQVSGYDIIGPVWAYPPDIEFVYQEANPHVMGEFIWTGFDYLGEPTPYGGRDNSTNGYWNGDWPVHSSYFGAVDLCGFPKDRFYLYQSQWTKSPMIHLLPHWNWAGKEGEVIPVFCYTNCEEAELFVNGKSCGKKVKGKDLTEIPVSFSKYQGKTFQSKYRLLWDVPYEPGVIEVKGYIGGKEVTTEKIVTAGKPSAIQLSVDRDTIHANATDLAYITVKVVDKDGNFCPLANNEIEFEVKGEGKLVAVDNGDPSSIESFQASKRKAFNGMCLAIVRSSGILGEIQVKAISGKLNPFSIVINTE